VLSGFKGTFRHAMDDKGRLAVPAKFRGEFAGGCTVARWIDGCLAIFPPPMWESIAEKVGALPFTDPNARLLQRHIFGGASDEPMDKQGRILIPAHLREYAQLEGETVVLGAQTRLELWAPKVWDGYDERLRAPDEFAAAIAGLGI
jgi:MraZ protein